MKAHRTDGVSLGFAVVFLGIVGLWFCTQVLGIGAPKAGWFAAGALIAFGILGLIGTIRVGRKSTKDDQPIESDTTQSDDLPKLQ